MENGGGGHACACRHIPSPSAGAFIIRRIVGIAGVADLRDIPDVDVRAGCERRALMLGRVLLKQVLAQSIGDEEELVRVAAEAAEP